MGRRIGSGADQPEGRVDYGHFSADGREYVITRFPTPRPWENYISNRQYGLRVDAVGAGYSALPISPGNRVTYAGSGDPFGKVFYLRDQESGQCWSLTWQPVGGPYDHFVCRHGVGYTIFEMAAAGLDTGLRAFVPLEDPVEIWTARVRNRGPGPRRLILFPYIEWHLAPYMRPWDNYRNYLEAHWDPEEEAVLATLWEPASPGRRYTAYAAVAPRCVGHDAERAAFMGSGSVALPQAVAEGRCRDSDMPGDGRAIAAFAVELDLAAGEEKAVTVVIGFEANPAERRRQRRRYLEANRIEDEFAHLREHWQGVFRQPQIETPDPRLDRMTNIWLKANVLQLTRVIREQLRGYRDTLQDAMGVVSFDADCARETILRALAYQYDDGHALRQFSYAHGPHDLRVYNDSPLWLVFAVTRYLKETGDFAFLDTAVPFFESQERASVFEHLARAVDWLGGRRGWHDLIRIDRGDWCDALDEVGTEGKGVSIWLSQAFHLALLEFADLCAARGEEKLADRHRRQAAELRSRVEEYAWDGEWYLAAISDRGARLGAKGSRAMEIYLNTQSWAVIGQIASAERAAIALDAADRRLSSPFGPLLLDPPFHAYDPDVGRLSVLRPGCGENGTVYVHAAVFYALANLMARRPDRALEILRQIAPMMEAQDPEVTQAAPYSYVNSYVGPCYPGHAGRTLTNWYTSSASWTLLAITDWMLGVRPAYGGLIIDPCLPAEWERACLRREWRGARYELVISKPKGLVSGRVSVTLEGAPLPTALVPPQAPGHHQVRVALSPCSRS